MGGSSCRACHKFSRSWCGRQRELQRAHPLQPAGAPSGLISVQAKSQSSAQVRIAESRSDAPGRLLIVSRTAQAVRATISSFTRWGCLLVPTGRILIGPWFVLAVCCWCVEHFQVGVRRRSREHIVSAEPCRSPRARARAHQTAFIYGSVAQRYRRPMALGRRVKASTCSKPRFDRAPGRPSPGPRLVAASSITSPITRSLDLAVDDPRPAQAGSDSPVRAFRSSRRRGAATPWAAPRPGRRLARPPRALRPDA